MARIIVTKGTPESRGGTVRVDASVVASDAEIKGGDQTYPMGADRVLGDGGNRTVYERPNGSRYALDKRGHGEEHATEDPIFGRARFDSRGLASGRWPGSLSTPQSLVDGQTVPRRASRHRVG